jgi:hypothetical protein
VLKITTNMGVFDVILFLICCIISTTNRWSSSSTCVGMNPMILPFRQKIQHVIAHPWCINFKDKLRENFQLPVHLVLYFEQCSLFNSEFLSWKLHGTIPFKSVDGISPLVSLLLLFQMLLDNILPET